MRRGAPTVGVACAALIAAAFACTPAQAAPPSSPDCLPLAVGSTGLIAVGESIPTPDQLTGQRGGFGPPAPPTIASTLPDAIPFKSATETFSSEYAFALRDGNIYVRPATIGRAIESEPWHLLELPACLAGRVTEISADGRLLLALGADRQLYSHDMPGGDLSPERWTWRWGPYFWLGSGLRLFDDVQRWAASEFTSSETFTDTSGTERAPIGVATVYLLRGDMNTITYIDPWLPNDDSREVCGPQRGTLPLAGLSGSGSTVFVAGQRGQLFTRLYDFDLTGANTVFGDYSWERGRPSDDPRWQLPGPHWVRHARPPGTITDRISIARTGPTSADRLLRVEGIDRHGRRGYFQKQIDRRRWRFVRTDQPLTGHRLPLADPARPAPPDDRRYAGTIAGAPATLLNFNPECSPATLRIQLPSGPLDLRLHSSDGLRQDTRAHGLDDTPREYNGAIEAPRRAAAPARAWMAAHLDGRFTTAPLAVTQTRLRFLAQCWELTLGGRPARPDQPKLLPDLGGVVARFTEQQKDGRPPPAC